MENEGKIYELKNVGSDVTVSADVCVIGSGAGGAAVARELAELGKRVVVLEEGAYFRPHQFVQDQWVAMKMLYRDKGMRAMIGKSVMPTMQGKAVGGTTILNSAICFRIPDDALNEWITVGGLKGISREVLDHIYDKIEKLINVRPTQPEVWGNNGRLFKKGCEALGYECEPIRRNEINCSGCAVCMMGCPDGSRQSTDISLIPQAVKLGATVYSSCKAVEVIRYGNRVTAVKGRFVTQEGNDTGFGIEVSCKVLVLSAGTMENPVFLKRTGLEGPSGWVGKNLLNHMGTASLAIFDEDVCAWDGAAQGFASRHFAHEGFTLETVWAPPEVFAMRLPGVGMKLKLYASRFRNVACWGVMVRCETRGRVVAPRKGWTPAIYFSPNEKDMAKARKGLKTAGDVYFAAGAKYIITGVYGMPEIIADPRDTVLYLDPKLDSSCINAIGNHPMGTCRMGENPSESVVDSTGRMHHMENMYIADASIFPTAPGVNPQLTIMAMATYIARQIKNHLG